VAETTIVARYATKTARGSPPFASLFEVAIPLGIFGRDYAEIGGPSFDLSVCGVVDDNIALDVPATLMLSGIGDLADCDFGDFGSVIVPTWPVDRLPVPPELTQALRRAHAAGCRVVGLCLGAFPVAASGLLDGRGAVTHWTKAAQFERMFPAVVFDPSPLYIDHGSVVTSAGSAAAIDCCIHLIRQDYGACAASVVARGLVAAPHRLGGQAQFATSRPVRDCDEFGQRLVEAASMISRITSVSDLAELTATSRRSLERTFKTRLGVTPSRWLTEQRLSASRNLLETTQVSIEEIARNVDFGSAATFRRKFKAANGVPPIDYRRTFRTGPVG